MSDAKMSDDALAIVLLCAVTSDAGTGPPPLAPTEYAALAGALHEAGSSPGALLTASDDVRTFAESAKVDAERLAGLLDRRAAIGMLLDRVATGGMWIVTRADAAYPRRMKRQLGAVAPPLLYGAGVVELLSIEAGVGVVGSRDLDEAGAAFARRVGETCAGDGVVLVSGGAKGADELGMRGALDSGGCAIGILGKDLAREVTRAHWRPALADGRLALVSAVSPWAGFNPGNLMARNKFIYAMCRAVFVASSDTKGGTWTGALENERRGWSRLLVRAGGGAPAGNGELVGTHGGTAVATDAIVPGMTRALVDGGDVPAADPPAQQLTLG